jgi:hypothetical protein
MDLKFSNFWFEIPSGGGKGIRTPDIQLAKLALYQLSYTPFKEGEQGGKKLNCVLRVVTRKYLNVVAFASTGLAVVPAGLDLSQGR